MLLQESDQSEFKRWLLPKLENISDAEAPVLADYVIALVIADDSETKVRRNCIESLEDFLGENTRPFVNDVIAALKDTTYLPQSNANEAKPPAPQSIRSIVGNANFEYEPHPSNVPFSAPRGPAATSFSNGARTQTPSHNAQQDGSSQARKRKLVEGEAGQGQDLHYSRNGGGNSRPLKQTSRGRGGRNMRGGGNQQQNDFPGFAAMPNFANLPPPPPGPLPFDPTDPASFFAMAAAFGANLPPMPALSYQARNGKCADYHNKGFCTVAFCPFEHEGAVEVPAEEVPEYDPEQSFLAVQPSEGFKKQTPRGQHSKTPRPRTAFSRQARHLNQANSTIVVEPIPKKHLSEDNVRGYFSQFGHIVDIKMQEQKRLAIVKYDDNAAAARAYTSPKAIFDNRFIRIYWYNAADFDRAPPAESYGDTIMEDADDKEEERLDPGEVARRQAEAQKAFDERRRKAAEAEARAAEVERKLKETNEEIQSIRKQLAGLSGEQAHEFSQNLAELQAEADSLFAQHEPSVPAGRGRGEMRGNYRGRGRGAPFPARGGYYPPRGGSWTSFGGAYSGHANFIPAPRRKPNRRLDNRPRRFAVAGIKAGTLKDEALRQYLLNITGCASIERHPEKTDTLILTFDERYQAEAVFYESNNIPDVGQLELDWVPNDAFGGIKSITTTTPEEAAAAIDNNDDDDASSATVGEQEVRVEDDQDVKIKDEEVEQQGDADMDVADDVDQWL